VAEKPSRRTIRTSAKAGAQQINEGGWIAASSTGGLMLMELFYGEDGKKLGMKMLHGG
jgi:hypothetical protein